MILPYGPTRRVTDNAVPSLNIISRNIEEHEEHVDFISNFEEHVLVENVPNKSLVPVPTDIDKDKQQHMPRKNTCNREILKKLRTQSKMLYKKKQIISKQRQNINRLRRTNKWDDVMKDLTNMQKVFIEMLVTNVKHAPQVCSINYYICISTN